MQYAWYLILTVVSISLLAIIEQLRYPETGAWIVAFIGAFFVVIFFVVLRLSKR